MRTSILIPFMNGDMYRERDLRLVLGWLDKYIDSETEIVVCEQVTSSPWISELIKNGKHIVQTGYTKFNKSSCWNHAFKNSSGDNIIGLDADIIIDPRYLQSETVESILGASRLVYPFDSIIDTTESETKGFGLSHDFLDQCIDVSIQKDRLRAGTRCYGGIWYMTRSTFVEIGGYNRGFASWGGEDDIFHWISTAMFTREKVTRLNNHVYHLWHPASNNSDYLDSNDYLSVVALKESIMKKHFDQKTAPNYCKVQKYLNGLVGHG